MEYGFKTIDRINSLLDEGINSISVIQRHSARNYDKKRPYMEPFMGLTEEGKGFAKVCAERLNFDGTVSFYSSMICRCLETSYMMEKGLKECMIVPNVLEESLFPFYVNNPKKVYEYVVTNGEDKFFRAWFDGELADEIIKSAEESAFVMARFMKSCLKEGSISFMISHDWNLYLIQEYLLKLSFFKEKRIDFLDGFVMYQSQGKIFLENERGNKMEFEE